VFELNSPFLVMTGDLDWADDACIADYCEAMARFSIRPVLFATHRSDLISSLEDNPGFELGIHPNFLPGSSHGETVEEVVEHITGLFPKARCFRSHGFVDSTQICQEFVRAGIQYDSNLCLYLQPGLFPLLHESGLMRFPVFWEDDIHLSRRDVRWDLDWAVDPFTTPGLKILNIHPIHLALNTPDEAFYQSVKKRRADGAPVRLSEMRFPGQGTRTLVLALLERLKSLDVRFHTLSEAYAMFSKLRVSGRSGDEGRTDQLTSADHRRYWSMDPVERQAMLRELYNERNSTDPYATSRDYNQRELEIFSLRRAAGRGGRILDLGCGNGFTLISLAREIESSRMVGVDFADRLIQGARTLLERERGHLRSVPEFVCGDAVRHAANERSATWDCVITERFLLNLPDLESQKSVMRDIHRVLAPGGRFLMCEGSMEGFKELNRLRSAFGLEAILGNSADNVSSLRFDDQTVERFLTEELGFRLVAREGFSVFFAIARALHPALISPQRPRFDARINDLARRLQEHMPLSPGIGSNVVWILEKP
jgi:SAM-dependent methyltransferase